jgi:hypothetical protein
VWTVWTALALAGATVSSMQRQAAKPVVGAITSSARTQAARRPPRFRQHVVIRRMAAVIAASDPVENALHNHIDR